MRVPSLEAAATPPERMAELRCTESALFWLERHAERGTTHLWWCLAGDMTSTHCLSHEESVGSRVNQYGGGSHAPLGEGVAWVRQSDQSLRYWPGPAADPAPQTWYTPERGSLGGLCADPLRQRMVAVEERSTAGTEQRLIALDRNTQQVIAEGADFYGAPAISPNGALMAWVEWSLPYMPWQRSRLKLAAITRDGSLDVIDTFDFGAAISQPTFTIDNALIVMSDHAGWWQPWRVTESSLECLSDAPFDHITTPWQLGERQHTWGSQGGLCLRVEQGAARLYRIPPHQSAPVGLASGRVVSLGQALHGQYVLAQSRATTTQLIKLGKQGEPHEVLRGAPPIANPPQPEYLSVALGDGGESVQGFLYPATQATPVAQNAPAPMIMRVHGGPTSACYPVYDPLVHYWVAQGFNVVDINPRGSGNFGRAYRQALHKQWGVLDTEDVETLTDALIAQGRICPQRCFIRGQSAGGFTVLNALANSKRFLAGTSLYGVTDAVSLARQTHRFESGYLDWLLGDAAQQQRRSPLHTLSRCPHHINVLLIQGALDKVVVPEQTHRLARQLEKGGGRAEVLIFANESHGMQNPQNRMTMIQQEFSFYRTLSP